MKKKINKYLLVTVSLTLVATLLMAVAIFHHMYREQILDDMRTYAEVISGMVNSGEEMKESYENPQPELRVTAINKEGEVIYDSQAGQETMTNHSDRPEIKQAEQEGVKNGVEAYTDFTHDMTPEKFAELVKSVKGDSMPS